MNRKKKITLTLSALILFIIGSGISLYQHQISVQAAQAKQESTTALATTKNDMELLYQDEKKELLNESITQQMIKTAEDSLQLLSTSTLNKTQQKKMTIYSQEIDQAKQMYAIETSLHKKYKNQLILADTIEFSKEERALDVLKKNKPIFFKKMTEIIKEGKVQLAIKKELLQFFEKYDTLQVKETVSRSDYQPLKDKVTAVASEPFETSLSNALVAIEKKIEENEQKEKEEKARIEKEKEKEKAEKIAQIKEQSEDTKGVTKEISPAVGASHTAPTPSSEKETAENQHPSDSGTRVTTVAPVQQAGIEGIIARSSTSQSTNQIIGVVASGSSANVYLFEKNNDQWQTILTMPGRVGYNGVGSSYEGSGRTPKGAYSLGFAFGTGPNPGTNLAYRQITSNSYWISNPDDSQYNTWQERTSSSSLDEHMRDYQTQYKYGMTLNYNNGVNGGSAFFLHVNGNGATAGCISVSQSNMLYLMQRIRSGAYIINVTSESELANY